jgi:glucuronate isomerase
MRTQLVHRIVNGTHQTHAEFPQDLTGLREASNIDIRDLPTPLDALRKRHDHFDQHGCRSSDHLTMTSCLGK